MNFRKNKKENKMKTIITLSILSAMLTACGSSNKGAGVTDDGRCDSGLISANNSLADSWSSMRLLRNYAEVDQKCQAFSATYPNSSCRAVDPNTQNEITFNSSAIRDKCQTLHSDLNPAVPAPTAAPTNPVVITPSTSFCSDNFIASYNLLGADAKEIRAAGSNAILTISAARKMNQDCKAFIAVYPATVCTAMDLNNNTTHTVDSKSVQPACNKIDDLLKSIDGGQTSMMMIPLLDSASAE
jgi:hypothetical protein